MYDDSEDYSDSGSSFDWNSALDTGAGLVSSLLGNQNANNNQTATSGSSTTMLIVGGAAVLLVAVLLLKK